MVETSGICKISDFGISKRTDDINMAGAYTSMQGTVFWMAPEVINPQKKGYNSKIDIWSVGCVVYEMWTGQRPWSGQEAMAVLMHVRFRDLRLVKVVIDRCCPSSCILRSKALLCLRKSCYHPSQMISGRNASRCKLSLFPAL